MPVSLEAIAARAFPEADHRAERCLAALREAVSQRDAEWCQTIWPENPEGAPAIPPSEAVGLIREGAVLAVKYAEAEAVAQERAALRQWITAERDAGRWSFTHTRELQAWLDARERSEKA